MAEGRINARLAKGSWPNEARSPVADIPEPQRKSQRADAPRLWETRRAGAGRMSRPGQDLSDRMGEGVRARSHSYKGRAPKLVYIA